MKEMRVGAIPDKTADMAGFLEESLEELECPMKISMKMLIAFDEIFSNIVNYSGAKEIWLQVLVEDGNLIVRFVDDGKAYNPLEHEDPDTTLSLEDREIGGLGIFMVKKTMDDVQYAYQDGQNMLSLIKALA